MSRLAQSTQQYLYANRFGLLVFCCLSLMTAIALATSQEKQAMNPQTNHSELIISSQLSQSKLIKGEISTVYLDVSIKAPKLKRQQGLQRASDIIVLLDRSGSMSEAKKMTYAKAAIHDLLSRLNERDRFALISFANNATVHSPLTAVTSSHREKLKAIVDSMGSGGGTNISAGINNAAELLSHSQQHHARKVLLLSDGQANQGITDLNGLNQLVTKLTQKESVLSTIGMGLDFNETLMSSLSDYGMGSYAYLEDLSGLGSIFSDHLNATRNIYAASSNIQLQLTEGVELVDAGGYPLTHTGANSYEIKTGQLLGGKDKKFVMSFKVKTKEIGNIDLGNMHIEYQAQGLTKQQTLNSEPLMLAVVAPENRKEAIASINKDVYKQSVLKNNLGRMQKKLSYWVREGNKKKADLMISEYRDEISKAEQQAAMPLASVEMDDKLQEMESSVADAFSGERFHQEEKRKRAAKSLQMRSINEQRAIKAN